MNIYDVIKQIALDELRAKGYAPNPADVHGLATQVAELVAKTVLEEVEKAVSEVKAAQPNPSPSTPSVSQTSPTLGVKVVPPTT